MATIREYFDTDLNKCLSSHVDWQIRTESDTSLPPVRARISQDLDANAKYWSFFIPDGADVVGYANAIFRAPETSRCVLSGESDSVYVEMGFADYPERATSETLVFTQRIFLYVDAKLPSELREQLVALGTQRGFHVLVRDREYAQKRSELEKPLVFISHDTRDKDSLVRELALKQIPIKQIYSSKDRASGPRLRTTLAHLTSGEAMWKRETLVRRSDRPFIVLR